MRILILSFIFVFTSCASYVNKIHREIDMEERASRPQAQAPRTGLPYGRYSRDRRPITNPVTLGGRPSTANTRTLSPEQERAFGRPRLTADDLRDNDPSGSLWAGKNSDNFLFVTNNIKRRGDIVIVEVLNDLKNNIQEELKRTFPASVRKQNEKDASTATGANQATENSDQDGDKDKVYDKISTQVVEEVNSDYVLVVGRKEVMYQKIKRVIEFQALVARKEISSTDSVKSTRILEPRVTVLRY